MSADHDKIRAASEKELVIQHRIGKNREILITGIVFLCITLIAVLSGLLNSQGKDSLTAYLIAGLTGFSALLIFGSYYHLNRDIRAAAANPDFESTGYYKALRTKWAYETTTPMVRQWADAFKQQMGIWIGIVAIPLVFFGSQRLLEQFLPGLPTLFQVIVPYALMFLGLQVFVRYMRGPRRIGVAQGVRVLTSEFKPFGPVIREARGWNNKSSVWLIIEPPGYFKEDGETEVIETNLLTADHVIFMIPLDGQPEPPFTVSSQDFVKRINHPDIRCIDTLDGVGDYLASHAQRGEIVIVMSAGDATKIGGDLLERLG